MLVLYPVDNIYGLFSAGYVAAAAEPLQHRPLQEILHQPPEHLVSCWDHFISLVKLTAAAILRNQNRFWSTQGQILCVQWCHEAARRGRKWRDDEEQNNKRFHCSTYLQDFNYYSSLNLFFGHFCLVLIQLLYIIYVFIIFKLFGAKNYKPDETFGKTFFFHFFLVVLLLFVTLEKFWSVIWLLIAIINIIIRIPKPNRAQGPGPRGGLDRPCRNLQRSRWTGWEAAGSVVLVINLQECLECSPKPGRNQEVLQDEASEPEPMYEYIWPPALTGFSRTPSLKTWILSSSVMEAADWTASRSDPGRDGGSVRVWFGPHRVLTHYPTLPP